MAIAKSSKFAEDFNQGGDFSSEVHEDGGIQLSENSVKRPELVSQLINELQNGMPIRDLAALVGVDNSTFFYWKKTGRIGGDGKAALCSYLSKTIAPRTSGDIEAYLDGEISLKQLLNPLWKTDIDGEPFNEDNVSRWLKYRANLDVKIRINKQLQEQIAGIARDKVSIRLMKALLEHSQKGVSLQQIAEETGISGDRLSSFAMGEALPCQDELVALSPFLPGEMEELQQIYITGT